MTRSLALTVALLAACTDPGAPGSGDRPGGAPAGGGLPSGGNDGSSTAGDGGSSDHPAKPPVVTAPALLLPGTALYPRVIRLAVGAQAGTLAASVVTPLGSGRMGGTVLVSHDDGFTFVETGHIDDAITSTGLCCATLFELPRAVGALAAGTLLWAASVGGDTPAQPMTIVVWSSADVGKSWTRLATAVTASVPRSKGGLWEPEFSLLADGTLVCHYSDETDPAHSQKLVEVRSSDGVAFGAPVDTVALAAVGQRPGMANVRRLPNGSYVMTYEICGVPGDDCTAHLRTSSDGWSWGSANDPGLRPATVDGKHFAHAPTLTLSDTPGANGRFYLVGQLVYDGAGTLAPENGSVVFANTEGGVRNWFEVPAPVPINAPYNNFCPNYSSSIVPLENGAIGLEIATRWDGTTCRAYFARGALLGTGDAPGTADGTAVGTGGKGVTSGATDRLVNLMSGLCLDVSGGSSAAGAKIEQWTCNGLAPQDWTLTAAADGSFSLRAANSGLCLTAAGGARSPGTALEQQACDGAAAQAWTLKNVGVGAYVLSPPGAPVCLDDSAGSTAAGTAMQLWTCNDLSPQIWLVKSK